jgi:lysine/ornithine N-monooxygenase
MKVKLDYKKAQLIDIPLDSGIRSSVYVKLIQFDFIPDFMFTIHELELPETKWVVSELSTGMKVVEATSRALVMTLAKQKLEKHKEIFSAIINSAIKTIKKEKFKFPINEIEE